MLKKSYYRRKDSPLIIVFTFELKLWMTTYDYDK
jgi:hypothetical protein